MPNIINYTNPQLFKQEQLKETLKERERLLNMGMEEITLSDLLDQLKELGYKIDKNMCHAYYNTGNAQHYSAYSVSYQDIKTKLSYAHYTQSSSNADNLAKLQKIRMNHFIFDGVKIWDL